MNDYYKSIRAMSEEARLEEAKSLRIHAENLRAHISRHNVFEFDIEKIADEYDNKARILGGLQ
jgi:hypothetical protein